MMRDDRGVALREIGTLFRVGTFAGVGDGALLERFVGGHGEAAEAAFAALVDRHGPMVLRICRRELNDTHDADDAFQATFLALLRGATSIRNWDSVASWLHGTALRIVACSRTSQARRRIHERRSVKLRLFDHNEPTCKNVNAIIHEEIARLPAQYRVAIVLCDLEGVSHQEASQRLGWPIGTLKSRIFRGREQLKSRLIRRGLAPGVGLVGGVVAAETLAGVGPRLAEATVRLAMGQRTAEMVSSAVKLADLFQRGLIMCRIRWIAVGVATFGMLATGATLVAQRPGGAVPGELKQVVDPLNGPVRVEIIGPYQVIYPVSYLVKWVPEDSDGHRPPVDMNPLIKLITGSVAPGTWKDRDAKGRVKEATAGIGTISQHETNLSLIVVQTAEAHAQIAERLDQLGDVLSAREGGTQVSGRDAKASGRDAKVSKDSKGMMGMMSGIGGSKPANTAEKNWRESLITAIDPIQATWAKQTDYQRWKDHAEFNGKIADFRKLFDEGTKAYKSADFARTATLYEDAAKHLQAVLQTHSNADESLISKKDFDLIVKRYARAYMQLAKPIPKNTPFADFLNQPEGATADPFKPTAKPGSGNNTVENQPPSAPGSAGGMMSMMGGGSMRGSAPGAGMASMMGSGNMPGMSKPTDPTAPGGYRGMMGGSSDGGTANPGGPGHAMGMGMAGYGSSMSAPIDKTELRLRAVEEKLDRLLKLLDTPKPDRDANGLRR